VEYPYPDIVGIDFWGRIVLRFGNLWGNFFTQYPPRLEAKADDPFLNVIGKDDELLAHRVH